MGQLVRVGMFDRVQQKLQFKMNRLKKIHPLIEALASHIPVSPVYEPMMLDAVNIDINNTCNLRCRFCFNTFDTKPVYMTKEIFEKILPVIKYTRDYSSSGNGVYLSCLYEPTLAPNFPVFLSMLPYEARKKAFFTSNLCRPMKEEQLRAMLDANLHHINISVETFIEERYQEITQTKNFESFFQNIQTLSRLYKEKQREKPYLRYITMILRINCDEITDIVRYCAGTLHATEHELRTPYISTYSNMAWNRGQLMEPETCACIEKSLRELRLPIVTDIHPRTELNAPEKMAIPVSEEEEMELMAVAEEEVESKERPEITAQNKTGEAIKACSDNGENRNDTWIPARIFEEIDQYVKPEYLFLRFHADGSCTEIVTGNTCRLPEMTDVDAFYKQKIRNLYRNRAKAYRCAKKPMLNHANSVSMDVNFDRMEQNEAGMQVSGWIRFSEQTSEDDVLMLRILGRKKEPFFFWTSAVSRPDVPRNPGQSVLGFISFITPISEERLKLDFLTVNRRTGKAAQISRYPIVLKMQKKIIKTTSIEKFK